MDEHRSYFAGFGKATIAEATDPGDPETTDQH
jgi:hypothetical protein